MTEPIGPLRDRRPLPLQLYEDLRSRIAGGEFGAGARLPAESALAAAYGVSRVTVREALRLLQRDGLVAARHGRGHFVLRGGPIREPVTELRSVTELLDSFGYQVETDVLGVRRRPAGEVAERLLVAADEPVLEVERLRRTGGEPLIYSVDVLPARLLDGREPNFAGSLVVILAKAGVELAYSHARIRAAALPRGVGRRIGVAASVPWLLLEQVNFDTDQTPVIFSFDYHRGDRFEFDVVRQRVRG